MAMVRVVRMIRAGQWKVRKSKGKVIRIRVMVRVMVRVKAGKGEVQRRK